MELSREQIEAPIPHRDPFLMVDRIVHGEPGVRGVGLKQVRADEDWARGHFPGRPIFPGVLIAEALAQVAAIVYLAGRPAGGEARVYLAGMDRIRIRRPVVPGDELRLEVEVTGKKRQIWMFDGRATVGDQRVADGSFLAAVEETP